jgi:hypothetical protein
MSRIRIIGLALVAVFAFSAVAAASASAAPEWLVAGAKPTSPVAVTSKTEGKLKLTDEGVGVTVECEGTDKGTVGPKSADTVSTVTPKNPCTVTAGTALCGTTANASALHLSWETSLIEPVAGEIRDEVKNSTNNPGWKVECLGGLKTTDECTGDSSTLIHNNTPAAGVVTAEFEAKSAHANCTVGGTGKGKVEGKIGFRTTTGATLEA